MSGTDNNRPFRRTASREAAEPRSGSWTPEEINLLIKLWGEGMSNPDIARRLGRYVGAISVKANRIGLGRKKEDGGKVRNCMSCGKEFWSFGAGNRICDQCKSGDVWRSGGNSHYFAN